MKGVIHVSREELYQKVWSVPASRLAAEFGISDVALNKTCKRMGIPRPQRGYWARLAAGQTLKRLPLPPPKAGQPVATQFNLEENAKRREEWQKPPLRPDREGAQIEHPLELALSTDNLHPLASRALIALREGEVGSDGRVRVCQKDLPFIEASPALHEHIAIALDALFRACEGRDIILQPTDGKGNPELRFVRGSDWIGLDVEEAILEVKRKPTLEDKRKPSSTWQLTTKQLSGKLAFVLDSELDLRGRKRWTERDNQPLNELLSAVIGRIEECFASFVTRREREAEADRQRAERARLEQQARKLREHEENLEEVVTERARNLWKASEWWKIHKDMLSFVEACELRWRDSSAGKMSKAQSAWLRWARQCAENMSPFAADYPDPASDGPFDASSIALGDDYPEVLEMPNPPSMQTKESKSNAYSTYHRPSPEPFPFWLQHRRHG
jgi:hypothetical protein